MPTSKLTCPHCGHDGTAETSRPPLGSFGFNYLAEGTVCREVQGYDETGRLILSGDIKCDSPQGSGARIECRSCWRTFPLPEGLTWNVGPQDVAEKPVPPSPESAPEVPAGRSREEAIEAVSRNLMAILQDMQQDMAAVNAGRFAGLEASISALSRAVEEISGLRSDLADLLAESTQHGRNLSALGEGIGGLQQQLSRQEAAAAARADSLASAIEAQRESSGQLGAQLAQLQGGHDASRLRLDAQAEVIRVLHAAAQEQITRREELKAAVQRLEQIAGGLDQVKPLPEGL